MTQDEALLPEGQVAEKPKTKRTRVSKKVAAETPSEENMSAESPRKRRGRPTKAELEARKKEETLLLEIQTKDESAEQKDGEEVITDSSVEEIETVEVQEVNVDDLSGSDGNETVQSTDEEPNEESSTSNLQSAEIDADSNSNSTNVLDSVTDTSATPKRKRPRKTKEEIMAAAAAKANALAQMRSAQQPQPTTDVPVSIEEVEEAVPEAAFESDETIEKASESDLARLQLMNTDSMPDDEPEIEGVWEGDPADGTDFIIIQDLPVEDNAGIAYFDMLDGTTPSTQQEDYDAEEDYDIGELYDFDDVVIASGLLEVMPDGYGFLRSSDYNYLSSPDDVHLNAQQIRQYSLRTGDVVECRVRPPRANEKFFTMNSVVSVNGRHPDDIRDRISFENLTPLFPEEKFNLCGNPSAVKPATRIVDLFAPIGKGQRSLIVAQPKTGKTMLMKDIANAIAANHPEAYIIMLLIDERPEEVTDMARSVNAEVVASTFDEPAERHVKIAGLVLEKAKRMVECGHDVVIFLDSITRLARAYNTVAPASGKVLTGGVDANALQKPKRFFGAARNIEGGGSLTIVATALTDTGSKMDEVIFEEFKGTGNSELQLDRALANKRIFPAVNLIASSTRRDDLLLDESTLNRMWILRKSISDMTAVEAMNLVNNHMRRTRDNQEFLMTMNG